MKMLLLFCFFWSAALTAQLVGDKQSGLASYYSTEYEGAETAYGVIYNSDELVAAHKAYPFNSQVRVTNEENGKSVTVRIIDKGPFIRGRIIELSERAASAIGMLGQRTVPVELTLLSTPDQRPLREAVTRSEPEVAQPAPTPVPARERELPVSTNPAPRSVTPPAPTPDPVPSQSAERIATPPAPAPAPSPPPRRTARAKTFAPGVYRISLNEPEAGRYAVQVGSYTSLESALDKVAELQGRFFDDILIHKLPASGSTLHYKVLLGPFPDQPSAQNYASDLKSRYQIQGFTVEIDRK